MSKAPARTSLLASGALCLVLGACATAPQDPCTVVVKDSSQHPGPATSGNSMPQSSSTGMTVRHRVPGCTR